MAPGPRGPIPKRSDERRRRNKPGEDDLEVTEVESKKPAGYNPPRANPDWHPVAKNWYNALKKSGQSVFFEPSDWEEAFLTALAIHHLVKQMERDGKVPAMAFAAVMAQTSRHLTTEGDRRRLRIELKKGGESTEGKRSDKIVSIYRNRLTATS